MAHRFKLLHYGPVPAFDRDGNGYFRDEARAICQDLYTKGVFCVPIPIEMLFLSHPSMQEYVEDIVYRIPEDILRSYEHSPNSGAILRPIPKQVFSSELVKPESTQQGEDRAD